MIWMHGQLTNLIARIPLMSIRETQRLQRVKMYRVSNKSHEIAFWHENNTKQNIILESYMKTFTVAYNNQIKFYNPDSIVVQYCISQTNKITLKTRWFYIFKNIVDLLTIYNLSLKCLSDMNCASLFALN